jgi:glutathione S-transferase
MAEYIDVADAIKMPGLRVVLSPGIPGPWSESAKAILRVKQLPYVRARQEVLGANVALLSWTGQATAPVVAWNDEPPLSVWIEQLALFERLAPTPRLVPEDFDQRVLMYGLANELMGVNGFIWNRRHIMVRDFTTPEQDPDVSDKFVILGKKYGYSAEAAARAPARCAEILKQLTTRLERQHAAGSRYFIGDTLTALDLYWACTAATLVPLPDSDCAMPPLFRDVYVNKDPVVKAATASILLEHRDYIYQRYLELPIDL